MNEYGEEVMKAAVNPMSDQMRRETERFLGRAMRTMRDPREAYRKLVRELRSQGPGSQPRSGAMMSRSAA